jgi:hypothetical protein
MSKNVSKAKSVSVSKVTSLDSDSEMVKILESKLSEISKEVSFLKSLANPNCVNQEKLKSELQKTESDKSQPKQSVKPTESVKRNVKSGKGVPKPQFQWVSKSDKCSSSKSESDPKVHSGEPILGWVPKRN